jgi:hypothetical protein
MSIKFLSLFVEILVIEKDIKGGFSEFSVGNEEHYGTLEER